jgi:hypothetical protein
MPFGEEKEHARSSPGNLAPPMACMVGALAPADCCRFRAFDLR